MKHLFFQLKEFFRYILRAGNAHGLHSPFVYALYTEVIADKKMYYAFDEIAKVRRRLESDKKALKIKDLGAGSVYGNSPEKTVGKLAKTAACSERNGQLLFKLTERFRPQNVFELGTSVGIGTLYLSKSLLPTARLRTFEGCPETAEVARQTLKNERPAPEIIVGNLDETLASAVSEMQSLDFVLFDANHRQEATLRYFKTCLPKAGENSVFVFDDIRHSPEMLAAWEEIKDDPAVTLTIDLFKTGLVFFRTKQPKQHFSLRF